jgi:tetratricopeptide (TPR) repeat protein
MNPDGALAMPTCFVVMGFGKKTDFAQAKTFDLDKSYHYIIKPAVEAAGYTCVRADEIQHAGNINVPMYERLYAADLVIADLSTANLNAFFELGVRYALKPRTTIVISEKGFTFPFDMGQVLIRQYEHLGDGIDYGEVKRMQTALTDACNQVTAANHVDSPVYTFLDLVPPELKRAAAAATATEEARTRDALAHAKDDHAVAALTHSFAVMMQRAFDARSAGRFETARDILGGIKAVQGEQVDPFVVQQLALATYKSTDRDPRAALMDARQLLDSLNPKSSSDPETLGLWGAIHKRLFEIATSAGERRDALNEAIGAYERAFYLRTDYYNGINYAFLLNLRAATGTSEEALADRVQAQRIRRRVLEVCATLLAQPIKGEAPAKEEYWIRASRAEALLGLGQVDEAAAAFEEAKNVPPPESWMVDTTDAQLKQLRRLLALET